MPHDRTRAADVETPAARLKPGDTPMDGATLLRLIGLGMALWTAGLVAWDAFPARPPRHSRAGEWLIVLRLVDGRHTFLYVFRAREAWTIARHVRRQLRDRRHPMRPRAARAVIRMLNAAVKEMAKAELAGRKRA